MARPWVEITVWSCAKGSRAKQGMSDGFETDCHDGKGGGEHYSAGGNPHDSQAPGESPLTDVMDWAITSAREYIESHQTAKMSDDQIDVEVKERE